MADPPHRHLSWSWLTKVPLLACPPLSCQSKPSPNRDQEDPAKSLPCPTEASSPPCTGAGGTWGHSRCLAQLGAQQLLVNGAAQLLWVSNPRWVQLLLLKYSFSSRFKSKGELRDWEWGKFPNKQTLREGLSRARQWKEQDFKVPCKRGGCCSPYPAHTRTQSQGS